MSSFAKTFLSSEFNTMLSAAIDRPLRYADFIQMPLPTGCTHDEIWHILITIQHALGNTLTVKPWFKEIKKRMLVLSFQRDTKRLRIVKFAGIYGIAL